MIKKTIWQRIKQNHLLLMVICCLAPIVLIFGFLSLSKGNNVYWILLIILLCPLFHIWMMRRPKQELYQCPECGFLYKEKEWAEKCEAWCKKHKSCNLEIIKHAIKR